VPGLCYGDKLKDAIIYKDLIPSKIADLFTKKDADDCMSQEEFIKMEQDEIQQNGFMADISRDKSFNPNISDNEGITFENGMRALQMYW